MGRARDAVANKEVHLEPPRPVVIDLMIPKIIHQTWKSRELPDRFKKWAQTFRNFLPDWEYRFWDDADCLKLVQERFPQYVETYTRLSNPAQRADLFRYMVVSAFGGLYVDIDCECKRPFDFIEPGDELIVGLELRTNSPRVMSLYATDLNEIYCQWAFLACPGHPVLNNLIEEIHRTIDQKFSDNSMLEVVKRTGPHAFTKSLKAYLDQNGQVKRLPPSFFGCCDGRSWFHFARTFLFPELFRAVYVRHHFEGSWIDKKVKKEMMMRNLFPFQSVQAKPSNVRSG